jgi:hypothetical protein
MKALLVISLTILYQVVLCQNSYMPSNAPGLVPIRSLNASQGGLSGAGLKYNDGSYVNEKEADIKGSPFLFDDWKKGNVLLKTKERIDSIFIKYNLYTDLLQVKIDDQEYQFNIEVSEFLIPDLVTNETALFRSGFSPVPGMNEKSFYQVLYDGRPKLLLKHKKLIGSEMTSTPGVKAKVFEDQNNYFILTASGKMEKIKKKNKGIQDLLEGEIEALKKMVESNKLKLVNDEEIIRVLEYYDSLTKE